MNEIQPSLGSLFTGNKVKAVYTENSHKAYRHNAFIEALHPPLDDEKVANLIRRKPIYDEGMRELSAMERADLVPDILDLIEPLPMVLNLEKQFSRMIRNGYKFRNPLSAEWKKQRNLAFEKLFTDRGGASFDPVIRSNATACAILGCSGSGKTTAVDSVLGLYDQVIEHSCYNGTPFLHQQLVWLKLECPVNGSTKALCRSFFGAVDDVLGTRYLKIQGNHRRSAQDMIPDMARVASLHGLGVLVIDEIQRLNIGTSGGAEEMLNFFVMLNNMIGVPVVLVGTFKAVKLLQRSFSFARRSLGQGDIYWSQMAHDATWDYFLERLWAFQYTKVPSPLTPQLNDAMYQETQGIIDIAVKLYMMVQWSIIGNGKELITPKVIHLVAKEKLRLIRKALKALKNGTEENLEMVYDLLPDKEKLAEILRKSKEKIRLDEMLNTLKSQSENDKKDGQDRLLFNLATVLSQAGYEREVAERSARQALARHAEGFEMAVATQDALRMAEEMRLQIQEEKERKRGKNTISEKAVKSGHSLSGDLRETTRRSEGKAPYDALLAAGNIKAADELFEDREAK